MMVVFKRKEELKRERKRNVSLDQEGEQIPLYAKVLSKKKKELKGNNQIRGVRGKEREREKVLAPKHALGDRCAAG